MPTQHDGARQAAISPMRLFGRRSRPPDDGGGPDPWLDDPAPGPGPAVGPAPQSRPDAGAGTPRPPADGPATAAARPAMWTVPRPRAAEPVEPDPVTDPFGFPPVPAATGDGAATRDGWAPPGAAPATVADDASPVVPVPDDAGPRRWTITDPGAPDPPSPATDPAEATALAGAFAADLLSWDEDDVARRARALGAHLASPAGAGLLGWTGTGRQRADLVLPGRARPDGDRVHVEVRVRIVPYRRVDARTPGAPEPEPDDPLGDPAAAPAPSARGWRGLAARWVRIEVTVARAGDRLVVDAGPVPQPPPSGDTPQGPR